METNECYLGYHHMCQLSAWCECLCHVTIPDYPEEG